MTAEMLPAAEKRGFPVTETALAAATIVGIFYCLWYLYTWKHLPQPFFYQPFDLFADWFNTAFWARTEGAYDTWQTFYPPLTFVFLRLLGINRCYPTTRSFDPSAGLAARECDWLGYLALAAIFLINAVLIYRVFRKWDKRTCIQRTICVALGMPMLDGLERGNLAMVAFTCMLLAFGPLVKSAKLRWLFAAFAVNFKIYLIGPVLALLLLRRWRWVESALIATVVVYLVSYALYGSGSPLEIYNNTLAYAEEAQSAAQLLDLWYPTTYNPLMALLQGSNFPVILQVGSRNVEILLVVVPALQHLVQGIIMLAAAAIWLRPEASSTHRAVNLSLLVVLVTAEPGGYGMTYFMLFTLMEPWRGFLRKTAIILCYLLAFPLDYPIDSAPEMVMDTFVGATTVIVSFKIMLGPFIRPLLIMIVGVCMALLTIREVWQDIRLQGWADRWRFHRDLPLLPWVRRPVAPGPRGESDRPT